MNAAARAPWRRVGRDPDRAPDHAGPNDVPPTVVIVGGGFTGAVLAHQLARRAPGAFRVVVVEPRDRLGAGVAYSTADPAHRINVPASRMSFIPSDPCNFDRWLKADGELRRDPEALTPDGRAFPSRATFGRYAAETIEPYLLSGAVEHVCARATGATSVDGRRVVQLSNGRTIAADILVIAATHPPPAAPGAFGAVIDDARVIQDTQDGAALDAVDPNARVLIVGCGLTMADIVASLDRRGHRGAITAISRRGLLSRGHAPVAGEYGVFTDPPSRTALDLVRRIRRTVAAAAAEGRPWQHVLDAARNQGRTIWAALPDAERRKIVRRLRPFWDVHRFRVAPQVEAAIRRRRADGTLELLVGEPVGASARNHGVTVTLKTRHGAVERTFDAVALATGPAHRRLVDTDPLVGDLAADGVVALDTVGLGLAVDERSRAVGPDGTASPDVFVAGPLARGSIGELMGLPEVARHAEEVAGEILRDACDARLDARAVA